MRRKLAGMPGGAHPPGPAHALRQRDRECRVQEARRERQAAAAGGRGCLAMRPRRGAAGIHLGWGAAAAGVQPRAEGAAVAWGVRRGARGGCGRRRGGRRQGTRPLGVALVRVAPAPPRVLALAGRAHARAAQQLQPQLRPLSRAQGGFRRGLTLECRALLSGPAPRGARMRVRQLLMLCVAGGLPLCFPARTSAGCLLSLPPPKGGVAGSGGAGHHAVRMHALRVPMRRCRVFGAQGGPPLCLGLQRRLNPEAARGVLKLVLSCRTSRRGLCLSPAALTGLLLRARGVGPEGVQLLLLHVDVLARPGLTGGAGGVTRGRPGRVGR
ncbi:MAG: hypothetical protein J3K34DRAFT_416475 [Monoraphidium minutum]|nr:MAG: hypothetical protein J3K34DRAFT_416475 [Monoraphidium minutum]